MGPLAGNIALRIKSLAHILGGQAVLAELYGTTQPQVSRWIKGKAKPQKKRLEIMAKSKGWPLSIFEEAGPMPADVLRIPAGMELGHRGSSRVAPEPSGGPPSTTTYSNSDAGNPDHPAVDRPTTDPFTGLPEPVLSQTEASEWIALDVIWRGAKSFVRDQHQRGQLIAPHEMAFWLHYLRVAAIEDAKRAAAAPPASGGSVAG
jgi:hypothetical protein